MTSIYSTNFSASISSAVILSLFVKECLIKEIEVESRDCSPVVSENTSHGAPKISKRNFRTSLVFPVLLGDILSPYFSPRAIIFSLALLILAIASFFFSKASFSLNSIP